MEIDKIKIIPQEEFILKIVRIYKSKCYYDIGAYPDKAAQYLVNGLIKERWMKIIAFEPSREGYLKYQKLFGRHKKIKLFNIGLGDKDEVRDLKIIPKRAFLGTLLNNRLNKIKDERRLPYLNDSDVIVKQRIKVKPLSSFVNKKNLLKPDIIKIDVEGWEGRVILGAQSLIEQSLPILFVEFHEGLKDFQNIQNFLDKLGYDYLELFHLNGLFNKLYPYYVFYPFKKEKKMTEIINEFMKIDFSDFYYKLSSFE